MKKLVLLLLSSTLLLSFLPIHKPVDSTFTVRFTGIERAGGTVRLALYSQKSAFMVEEKAVLHSFKVSKPGLLNASVAVQVQGNYAFAAFLDENNNKKLDKNLVGVPIEPYGFSKPPPSKWRLPTWDEVMFEVASDATTTLNVELKKWAF